MKRSRFIPTIRRPSFYGVIGLSLLSLPVAGLSWATVSPATALQHQALLAHSETSKPGSPSGAMPNQSTSDQSASDQSASDQSMPDKMPGEMTQPTSDAPFRQIEQPLSTKVGITVAAFALIGLELWWFLGKPRRKSTS